MSDDLGLYSTAGPEGFIFRAAGHECDVLDPRWPDASATRCVLGHVLHHVGSISPYWENTERAMRAAFHKSVKANAMRTQSVKVYCT